MTDRPAEPQLTETERHTGEHFDEVIASGRLREFTDHQRRKVTELLDQMEPLQGQRLFEPGCGSGRLTELLAERVGPEGRVQACELSRDMLAVARGRGLGPEAHFGRYPAERAPFEDGWFDRTICFFVFPHFADRALALREFARVTRPGGELHVIHFESREDLNRMHAEAGGRVANDRLPDEPTMRALMQGAGWAVESIRDETGLYWLRARQVGRGVSPR